MQTLQGPGLHVRKNEVGNRYARLLVVGFDHVDKRGNAHWLCRCDCGKEKVVCGYHLRSGEIVSCRCYQKECAASVLMNLHASEAKKFLQQMWQDAHETRIRK